MGAKETLRAELEASAATIRDEIVGMDDFLGSRVSDATRSEVNALKARTEQQLVQIERTLAQLVSLEATGYPAVDTVTLEALQVTEMETQIARMQQVLARVQTRRPLQATELDPRVTIVGQEVPL